MGHWLDAAQRRGRLVLRNPAVHELRDKRLSSQRMRAEPGLTNPVRAETIRELHSPMWACGAAGSALPWHGRGHRFDPDQVHQITPPKSVIYFTPFEIGRERIGANWRQSCSTLLSIASLFRLEFCCDDPGRRSSLARLPKLPMDGIN